MPPSPMIFALAMEPVASWLRVHATQWGIPTQCGHQMIYLYADDALVYLRDPDTTLPGLMEILDIFGELSGP